MMSCFLQKLLDTILIHNFHAALAHPIMITYDISIRDVTRGGIGGAIPRAPNYSGVLNYCGGAGWLRGRQKVPTVSQVLSTIQ